MEPFIFVTVGTDHHRFNRLVDSMDRWVESRGRAPQSCLVQHGSSDRPRLCAGEPFLSQSKLRKAFSVADVVVCHGGPATIAEARSAGVVPICVPRDPGRGEHVDQHQQRFARRVARDRLVVLAEEETALFEALDRSVADPGSVSLEITWPARDTRELAVAHVGGLIESLLDKNPRSRRGW